MRNACLGALTIAALVGCSRGAMLQSQTAATLASSNSVFSAHPSFQDSKPHLGVGDFPSHFPVHGIDVSRWQSEVDWPLVRASGVSFAFIKATEGGDLVDPMFHRHWSDAGAAGMRRGAYHYYYFCRSAEEQARWFIRNVPLEYGALPPVVDMEWTPHSKTCTRRPPAAVVQSEARVFLDALERHYGRRPVIYTTVDFFADTGIGALTDTHFWLRSVAAHPRETYPGMGWTFWQYTGTGIVPGVNAPVDINVFAGSSDDWHRWAQ